MKNIEIHDITSDVCSSVSDGEEEEDHKATKGFE
jgi:hypothetical protein